MTPPATATAYDATARPIRICLVEDQTLFRETLGRMLESQDGMMVVGEATDGEQGVGQALSLKPDLVIMDVALPKIDGLEATRQIKAALPGTRVVGITAYPSDTIFRRALGAGVDSFVLKDAKLEELVATIRLTHSGSRLFNGSLLRGFMDGRRQAGEPYGLTVRELEVLQALVAGQPNNTIAIKLRVSEKTVRNHVSNIYAKLQVKSRTEAALFALHNGIVLDQRLPASPKT